MNIAINLEPETKEDFEYIVRSYGEFGSLYSSKDTISLNFPLTDANRFITFLQRLYDWCSNKEEDVRCKAVCRNGSACLNNSQFNGFCWKHSTWGKE